MLDMNDYLKQLHMSSIRRCYEQVADQARKGSWTYEQYLLEVIKNECETRFENRIARNLRSSKLPPSKTFDNFDTNRLPAKVRAHLSVLKNGSFLDRSENILAFGNPGSGKTHLVCAIGHELIAQGKRVLFTTCNQLVQDLLIAKRDLSITKYLKKLRMPSIHM
jgi:DNA replication protein DnaC